MLRAADGCTPARAGHLKRVPAADRHGIDRPSPADGAMDTASFMEFSQALKTAETSHQIALRTTGKFWRLLLCKEITFSAVTDISRRETITATLLSTLPCCFRFTCRLPTCRPRPSPDLVPQANGCRGDVDGQDVQDSLGALPQQREAPPLVRQVHVSYASCCPGLVLGMCMLHAHAHIVLCVLSA